MSILEKVSELYRLGIPFVVFRKPNVALIELFEQSDNEVYMFNNSFSYDGFVLAPFRNDQQPSFVIKADRKYFETMSYHDVEALKKKEIPFSKHEKEAHIELVKKAIEEMKFGNFEKVVISRKITLEHRANPIESFQKMLNHYPSAFCYLFSHPKIGTWLAATPEKLLNVTENQLYTMALAGTQPVNDQNVYAWKEKEQDEQQIVTNVIVRNLHSHVKNLNVSKVKTVRAGNVVHLCTDIMAQLKDDENPFIIANKLHPTPAVCGFPYHSAKQFIIENENYDRTFYSGYCGIIQKKNNLIDFYVNLRCMQVFENHIFIYVGGGILKDSNPQAEWEETQNKAQTMYAIV